MLGLIGNIALIIIILFLLLSFSGDTNNHGIIIRLMVMTTGLVFVFIVSKQKPVNHMITLRIEKGLKKWIDLQLYL